MTGTISVGRHFIVPQLMEILTSQNFCSAVARTLLRRGADVNAVDHRGSSALHKALQFRNFYIVTLLIGYGANVNTRNMYNSTSFHEAIQRGNIDIAQLLLKYGADINALDH